MINKDIVKEELFHLYQGLLNKNTFENICAFCIQWGTNFPSEKNKGILFIGKAVNGWITDEIDVNILFGESAESIFARSDQMKWVHNLESNDNGYNTKKSAFWRVIKQVAQNQNIYKKDEWYSYIAWSNLCKLAPFKGGNPSNPLYYEQLVTCQEILKKEIEIFSPKFVVMFTSGWEKDFLYFLNDNKENKIKKKINWDSYETKLYEINGVVYIVSQHPQGKNETKHINTIVKLIDEYN
jgi:hypothetical protein